MEYIPFNSRNPLHKTPFGAVRAGEKITFKLVLPRSLSCSGVELVIRRDSEEEKRFSFFWLSMQGENEEWWCLDYIQHETGLYFYHFEYDTPWGKVAIRRNEGSLGLLSGGKNDFQLTVFEKDFQTPQWLRGGLIYQIFPDRFYASGSEKKNVPSDRVIRSDWGGEPSWRPDERGRVLNNDYFGGDLEGIRQKLGYLKSLGVSCIYLNPICEAQSNHRYDTSDYENVDSLLGTQKDLERLCADAEKNGISVIIDGVFSHTGDDSRYFNKKGRYNSPGAYQSKQSPFFSWYSFRTWPYDYRCWWNFETLPEVNEENESFISFITGKNGVARRYLKAGVRGWRLDVADELPDQFLDEFRKAVKSEKDDALILGEVWEDASNKCSYGERRRYLQGAQLDSVMNYPFSEAVLGFVRSGIVEGFSEKIMTVLENYPKCVVDVLMNHIGTHDTMRAITALAGESCEGRDRQWQSTHFLSPLQYERGVKLLKLAAVIQYTLPGVPSIYYGDEAGMQGYKDPFNRVCYPWGDENAELLGFYKMLGSVRKSCDCFKDGTFYTVSEMLSCLAFVREGKDDSVMVIVNRNEHEINYRLPEEWKDSYALIGNAPDDGNVYLAALSAVILRKEKSK